MEGPKVPGEIGEEANEPEPDPGEALRLVIIGLGLLANLAIVYWQVKDTADMIELRARVSAWWRRHVSEPERRRRELARMEGETLFEAIQVVEGGLT